MHFKNLLLSVVVACTAVAWVHAGGVAIEGEGVRFRESVIPQNQFHKYYLSVSNVTYSKKANALQMISRFFIDDLEDVLNERLSQKVTLGNPEGLEELKPILDRYISKRLTATVDGQDVVPVVLGAEYDNDQIIVYIEMPSLQQPQQVEMSYKALFELFPDQKNLVHFKIAGQRKSLLNTRETPIERVKF